MSKRFPIPDFDRDQYKNLAWLKPQGLSSSEALKASNEAASGPIDVAISSQLAAKYKFEGEHLHAMMCTLPPGPVCITGRSWAWPVQRALILDSLDASSAKVIADWTTPRPMSTRIGPDSGIEHQGGPVYVLTGHRYGDHWISNRSLGGEKSPGSSHGFSVLSASDDEINDFHACNIYFSWK